MTVREDSPRMIDSLRELSQYWKQPITDDALNHFVILLSQHPDNFERFQKLNPRLQETSMWNYVYRDACTPISLYLDTLDACGWYSVPRDTNAAPSVWLQELHRMNGVKEPFNPEFMRVVRWFDYYLSRSSNIVLFLLRDTYGEDRIVRMGFKLAEHQCDVRVIDFVALARDWDKNDLDSNFNFWTAEMYRYRTLSDEQLMKNSQMPI